MEITEEKIPGSAASEPPKKKRATLFSIFSRPSTSNTADKDLLSRYDPKAFFAYNLAVLYYAICLLSAVGMVAVSFVLVFMVNSDFYRKVFGIGVFITGSGLIFISLLKNPLPLLQQFLNHHIRTQIVISQLLVEQDVFRREVEKLKNQDQPTDPKQLEAFLHLMQENTEKASKNLNPHDYLLD